MSATDLVSPWLSSAEAATYLRRGRRFILKEIHAGRLRAATVGGRREILTCRPWCDEWVETQTRPVVLRRAAR
jgi:excisionase family DNA binding protein